MKPQKSSIEKLMEEHASIYKEFLPTLKTYQQMASKAVDLQVKIFDARLRETFPEAEFNGAPLIVSLSARETPAKLNAILAELAKKQIKAERVIFDPQNLSFNLYGK